MGQDMMSGTFGVLISFLILVLLILWFFLPFAVFGIKDRLDKLIEQNRKLISLMESQRPDSGSSPGSSPGASPGSDRDETRH